MPTSVCPAHLKTIPSSFKRQRLDETNAKILNHEIHYDSAPDDEI
jgi:hypothetical protein